MGANTDEAASALSELSWARFPDGNIDMKETEKGFVAALSKCKDQTPLLIFKMAAALAQADKEHRTECKAAGVDHQELSSACYRLVFGHQGSTKTMAPGLGFKVYTPPSTVGSSAVRSFDVEVRKELVKAKVDLTATSDEQVRAEYRQSMINDAHKILIPVIKRMIQGLSDANDKDAAALVGLLDPASTSGSALSSFEDNYMEVQGDVFTQKGHVRPWLLPFPLLWSGVVSLLGTSASSTTTAMDSLCAGILNGETLAQHVQRFQNAKLDVMKLNFSTVEAFVDALTSTQTAFKIKALGEELAESDEVRAGYHRDAWVKIQRNIQDQAAPITYTRIKPILDNLNAQLQAAGAKTTSIGNDAARLEEISSRVSRVEHSVQKRISKKKLSKNSVVIPLAQAKLSSAGEKALKRMGLLKKARLINWE